MRSLGRAFVGELGLDGSVRARARGAAAHRRPGGARGRRARRVHGRGPAGRPPPGAAGGDPRNHGRGAPGPAPLARPRPSPSPPPPPRPAPIWPTSAASRSPATRSRWRPRAGTTCCWSARPARARRCWPAGWPGCCPSSAPADALEVTCIHSAAGLPLPPGGLIRRPPLRAPHHGASAVSLVGGGSHTLQPGEISLAHHGVLFLDELGEFEPCRARQPAPAARRGGHPGGPGDGQGHVPGPRPAGGRR